MYVFAKSVSKLDYWEGCSMKFKELSYDDLDIKLNIGGFCINILCLRIMVTSSYTYIKNHCHSSYELHIIPQGKGVLTVGKDIYHINPGSLYMTGPGIYHIQKSDEKEPMIEYCINFEFDGKTVKNQSDKNGTDKEIQDIVDTLRRTKFWFGEDEFENARLFEKAFEELENCLIGYYLSASNHILQIILNTAKSFSGRKRSDYEPPRKIPDDRRRYIIDLYFEKYDKKLSPEDLAEKIGVCTRQIGRVMKKYYSSTFKLKLTETRLENACNMLLNTNLSVEEIAEKVGYSSSSYFCRVFKEYYNCTPSQYRNSSEL
jgi:AraC-like DNA-binding protein